MQMDNADSDIDPALLALLALLWEAARADPGKPWSLAKIGKRAGLARSALQRHLNRLGDAGLAQVTMREEGGGDVLLTAAGRELCAAIFPIAAND
jgi:DNA-binding MarR family transcriptional regulator